MCIGEPHQERGVIPFLRSNPKRCHMTVIVYRDGILASDSLYNFNDVKIKKNKIERFYNGLYYGSAGTIDDRSLKKLIAKIEVNPEKGVTEYDFPTLKQLRKLDIECSALVIVPQNIKLGIDPIFIIECVRMENEESDDCCIISLPDKPAALGTGADCARASLKRGATAMEAVLDAIEFDVNCDGPVNVLEIKDE